MFEKMYNFYSLIHWCLSAHINKNMYIYVRTKRKKTTTRLCPSMCYNTLYEKNTDNNFLVLL